MALPIMLMIRQLDLGGTERQISEVARGLDRSRFEVHVGCFRPEGIFGDELRAAGVPVVVFPVRSFQHPSTVLAARQMGAYLKRHRIALVHAFDVPSIIFGVPVARLYGVPRILSSQRAHRALTGGGLRLLLRMTDFLVDGIVVNCQAMARELTDSYRVSPSRIHLCYNGIDLRRFNPAGRCRPESLRGASTVLGITCQLREEKGLDLLLKAFRDLLSVDPALMLVFVGEGPLKGNLEAQAQSIGVLERCLFVPVTANVEDWLRAIDIFVLPSLSEALSNSLMEAMACGCAVVASRVGGNVELVRHEDTGLLFRVGDAGDLAEKLALLVRQPALRRQLAIAGAESIRRFSAEESLRCMERIYEGSCRHAPGDRVPN
jgi:L-malate glycosyltransferase